MPITGNIQSLQSQSLLLNARLSTVRQVTTNRADQPDKQGGRALSLQGSFEASYAALGIRVSEGQGVRTASVDSVQIDLAANLNIESANQILKDQVAEKINQAFKDAGVDIDIREVERQNLDTSPEATSKRIVDFATGFLGAFAQNHKDQDEVSRLEDFMSLVRSAIDDGFAGAMEVLKGIADISGPISENIDKTYGLVQDGLEAFRKKQLDSIKSQREKDSSPPEPKPSVGTVEGVVI